jgi:predicted O-methyltransferase YrrM
MDKMKGNLQTLLKELENFGMENDSVKVEKSERMRNVTPETGKFLSFMATLTQAKNILEIGTSNGYSTLWLAESAANNGGQVTTLEYSGAKAELAKMNFEKSGMQKWIDLHAVDAGEFITRVDADTVDLLFLDSDRTEYMEWWMDLKRMIKKGGLVIVDNITTHWSELKTFVDMVSSDADFSSFTISNGCGLLLLTKK